MLFDWLVYCYIQRHKSYQCWVQISSASSSSAQFEGSCFIFSVLGLYQHLSRYKYASNFPDPGQKENFLYHCGTPTYALSPKCTKARRPTRNHIKYISSRLLPEFIAQHTLRYEIIHRGWSCERYAENVLNGDCSRGGISTPPFTSRAVQCIRKIPR